MQSLALNKLTHKLALNRLTADVIALKQRIRSKHRYEGDERILGFFSSAIQHCEQEV